MTLEEKKSKVYNLEQHLKRLIANFRKDGSNRKTPQYKSRKLKELGELWNQFVELDEDISNEDEEADDKYDKSQKAIEDGYGEYNALLKLLPDASTKDGDGRSSNVSTSEDDIDKLINSQTVRLQTLKRIISQIEEKTSNQEEMSASYCQFKINKLNSCWERISVVHEEAASFGVQLDADYLEKISAYEEAYEDTIIQLQELSDATLKTNRIDSIKLPRVVIPKFEGDYLTWVSFRDLFVSMVIENKSLSDAQRMQVLKTNLGGEAEGLITDLTISNADFTSAWERLTHRYENKRLLVFQHLRKIITQPIVKHDGVDSKLIKKLLDTTDQGLLALQNLGRPVKSWDDWIVITIAHKLNEDLRREWEKKIGHTNVLPTWSELKEFLEEELSIAESIENGSQKKGSGQKSTIKSNQVTVDANPNCIICKKKHSLFKCFEFRKMKPDDRMTLAKKEKLCFRCLGRHENKLSCDRENPCKKCKKNHNTWLHPKEGSPKESQGKVNAVVTTQKEEVPADKVVATALVTQKQALLATAMVATQNAYGQRVLLRALMDSGSQGSMITRNAVELLHLKPIISQDTISPLGENARKAGLQITMTIKPRFESTVELNIELYILKKLTRTLPDENLHTHTWTHLKDLTLADPRFHRVGPIDMLLGTDVLSDILESGLIKGGTGQPMAQQTTFGWIVSGKIDPTYPRKEIKSLLSTCDNEELNLKQFWELEELNPKRNLSPDEQKCEKLFLDGIRRDNHGRFMVNIPFKDGTNGPESLGSSKSQCLARFAQLEKRLARDNSLRIDYTNVMKEYLDLGHMKLVTSQQQDTKKYYIPHHAVLKPDSLTTKTRVVFDASAKTSTGRSLNELMFVGAKQQPDLMDVLIKWRKHQIVFKADVAKMYRQIQLSEQDQRYHTILWRNSPKEKLEEYQLTTVTFGTTSAPFLASRTLKHLAELNKDKYPIATEIITNDFYVDDLISGSETLEGAIKAKEELIASLQEGKFTLRKWSSNSQELLDSLPIELTEKSLQSFSSEEWTKALGLQWNPRTDQFNFEVNWLLDDKKLTKRKFLSEASKLFDPLGWLAPVVINAKIWMQQIWLSDISWDIEVPEPIRIKWQQFRKELPMLKEIKIDRWINHTPNREVQIIGFCDASEKAYAAVVYTRIVDKDNVTIKLILSKTRVAPIKMKTTLPRLELCGAVLLGNLLTRTKESLQLEGTPTYAWSDSTATLGWLNGEPNRWRTFVANRVSEIQSNTVDEWNYVPGNENPADCATRGLMPLELRDHNLWWYGPEWLKNHPSTWHRAGIQETELEKRNIISNAAVTKKKEVIADASSWSKLVRVIAYCLRMKGDKPPGVQLTLAELTKAKTILHKRCQQESFPEELIKLQQKKRISKRSKLIALDPFLDDNGVMRVGGRLENAIATFNNKHPVILPKDHQVTQLIVRQIHLDTLHGGPLLMVNLLRKNYWILQAKRLSNEEYKKCVVCRRHRGKTREQIMGQLPKDRVTLERAFLHTSIDYAGPIEVKSSKLRNARIQKGYIAIFVCMGTKAVHIELVSDQTSEAFLATLNRFIARRGLCIRMYSDNGGNLVGGSNKLKREEQEWLHQKNVELAKYAARRGIDWKFIPPEAPHFGGLHERGVRSMKNHLYKQLKTVRLTFEEYNTVLCQIEACLNSRPLCPLTADRENLNALTPGHFLIGDALLAPPEVTLVDNSYNRNNRWRHLQLIHQHFWTRWSKEYLSHLQQRQKWRHKEVNFQKGDLVVLKDEQLPPRAWLMGRIIETHPGKDGLIRVVTVKTAHSQYKRPITKLCLLMEASDEDDDLEAIKRNQSTTEEGTPIARADKQSNPDEVVKGPAQDNQRSTRVLRPRNVNGLVLMMASLAFIMLLGGGLAFPLKTTNVKPVKITNFAHESGIYFEDIGTMNIIRTEWHMYIRFSMKRYMYEFKTLVNITQKLTNECADTDMDDLHDQCGYIVNVLQESMADIEKFNILLMSNGEHSRHKRAAPLNVVGWIGHELFGVMAADQADHIENQMNLVDQNEEHLLNLIKNQSSIVDTTVALIQNTEEEINKNYAKLESVLDTMTNETDKIRKNEKVIGLALYTSLLIHRFRGIQRDLVDTVTDVHQGHISSNVFNPQQLREQLIMINNNLPSGSKLPGNSQQDIKSLYKLITGKARVTTENMLLDLVLPLVSSTELQLFHIVPFPINHEGNQLSIIPESEYISISLKRDKFYQLNEKHMQNCIKPTATLFICKMKEPMYNIQSEKSRCERDLIANTDRPSSNCRFNLTTTQSFWIPLKRKNHWIFGTKQQLTLNVVCSDKPYATSIQGTGLMEVEPGCEVIQSTMSIIAEANKAIEGQFNFYPPINLSATVTKEGRTEKLTIFNFTLDHHTQVASIHNKLETLNQQSHRINIHHTSHMVATTLIILMLVIVIIGTWLKRETILALVNRQLATPSQATHADTMEIQDGQQLNERHLDNSDASQFEINRSALATPCPAKRISTARRYGRENVQS